MIGQQRILDYPRTFTTHPDYTAHNGQLVTVKRELVDGEEYDREDGDRMYEVQAADGWIGHVYESELVA